MSDKHLPSAQHPPPVPEVGTILIDRQGRIGEFRAVEYGSWWLRPVAGGLEWTVEPGSAEPVSPEQRLHTKVAVVNEQTKRRGQLGA
ncbi:hypothetical protein IAG44_14105 [Streptomyces roseirectus]|uniref:Uncharacterized protein n=1 Tax=Streptomyces roseirectus TaxID=2768066 RepID=A0A7H0ICE8_9ACTN|nr:hypothetical protein [Streptomyces roseirectus]QNP70464.1 hypothetical protein IAG44_14105 [Streptomyces roseirectus]